VTMKNEELSSDVLTVAGFESCMARNYRLGASPRPGRLVGPTALTRRQGRARGARARSEYSAEDNISYVMSPRDIVLARPRDMDDHIAWLLERERCARAPAVRRGRRRGAERGAPGPPPWAAAHRFDEAMAAAEGSNAELRVHNLLDVGQKYMKFLIEKGAGPAAAGRCPRVRRDAPRAVRGVGPARAAGRRRV